jgi:WD40 repeat protein
MLRHVLENHKSPVTAITCVYHNHTHYLITSGWDRRLILWNLNDGKIVDVFKNGDDFVPGEEELAADGIITDLAYSPERNEFAYSSADKQVYIRHFSTNVHEMKLKVVLQGHKGEVLMVCFYYFQFYS